jgi:mRNA-degrading endonuclease RelE of RelBE toxin-antitoxin system
VSTPYHIKISPVAVQQIKQLPVKQQRVVIKLAEALSVNPRPPGANKVSGMTGLYCETVHPLRLVYKIEDQEILLLLVKQI